MPAQPTVLMTNDDGIRSHFLRRLACAHRAAGFRVCVVAPAREQSWISRALSRHREVEVSAQGDWDVPAWAVDGTPTDCVNLALAHLLDFAPDIVVSGINLGFNANLPYILGSGTVAGALEGAFWALPAAAYSLQLPPADFARLRATLGKAENARDTAMLDAACAHAVRLTREVLETERGRPMLAPRVYNVNIPHTVAPDTPVENTRIGYKRTGALFQSVGENRYAFRYEERPPLDDFPDSDERCLARGHISRTVLDFGKLNA